VILITEEKLQQRVSFFLLILGAFLRFTQKYICKCTSSLYHETLIFSHKQSLPSETIYAANFARL